MIKRILIIINFLFFVSFSNAQTFKIKSLDGIFQQIHLMHEVGDQKLVISCFKDTIVINDFINISKNVAILKDCFLEIQYSIRSGSNQSTERLILLCVNKNKLYQAVHMQSIETFDIDEVYDKTADSLKLFDEHGDYELKVDLTGSNIGNYKLKVYIHDESKSKYDPKTDHNYNAQVILGFDSNNDIFYSYFEDISQYFTVYNLKIHKKIKQYFVDTFPIVKLNKIIYYYIKGGWYEKGNNNELVKFTYE